MLPPPFTLRTALRGFVTYAIAVLLSVAWPSLMRLKVLPVFVHAAGSPFWRDMLDTYGSPLLGVIASLALGDFVARRHPGRAAFLHGSIAFGLVLVLSLGLSVFWRLSFVDVYGPLWLPDLLAVLAGAWLGQRARFHQFSLYAGLFFWPLTGLVALFFLVTVVRLTWRPGRPSVPLLVVCLVILLVAVVRTVLMGRRLLRASPRR